ncbi:MAG: nitroreductase family protein [Candidatus Omnitrophota bacterium]
MDTIEIIKARRSIREYKDKPILKEVLENIVDAGRFAPTARGVQPWEFIIVTKPENLKRIADLAENGRFIAQAACCIAVFCSNTKYYLEDGCAATENILIASASLGIGSCWVAGDKKPYVEEIARLLSVPDEFKLISLIALGYPQTQESFKIVDKRNLSEIIHWNKF